MRPHMVYPDERDIQCLGKPLGEVYAYQQRTDEPGAWVNHGRNVFKCRFAVDSASTTSRLFAAGGSRSLCPALRRHIVRALSEWQ